ncbi:TorF family putative porin [Ottowia sp.]|jgi:uncharacterized protein (TIGR02001 family)|uniref:TorF family putative porin n=1 Tax=Ottowia sp. TaxID=1898956 RepID=UPI0025DF8773|nr:TorF family putative porin [Ottowia sp.]MBK6614774.1 hypothetical protein [Ottowia sp.]MBK6745858.1 hypothetical protein [Ottowia sp.]
MTTTLRTLQRLTLATAALAASGAVLAQATAPAEAPTPEHSFSFNAALTTDYRYRGIAQTRLKPAVSAGADYSHASGLYVGTWLTTIKWVKDAGGDAPLEWDVYGGYKGTAGPIGYDVGLLRYQYPNAKLGTSPNTTEIYGALSYEMFTVKYSHSLTNLFGFDDSKGSGYLDLSANFDLGDGWSVVPHVGRQWIRHNSAFSYTDWALTLNKDFGNGLSASAAVIGTNADKALYVTPSGRFTGRTGLVVGVKYTF